MKKSILSLIILVLFLFAPVGGLDCSFAKSQNFERNETLTKQLSKSSKAVFLMDDSTGEVLYEKNSNERFPIASMTKLALLGVTFDAINQGLIKPSDEVCVSKNSAKVRGSSAFLDAGSRYSLEDLIKTVIIASANDSAVAISEFICGSETAFVSKMNKFAESLDLKNTHFENCTGLPCENHYSSAYDISQIYRKVCGNELFKKYSKIWLDKLIHPSGRKTDLVNTNKLVKTYDGIEGGKTGFTNDAGFCLTASAVRGNMRLVGSIIGSESSKVRFSDFSKMLDFGFANFMLEEPIKKDVPVCSLKLKNAQNEVLVYPEKDINLLLSKDNKTKFSTDYEIFDLSAPIYSNSAVGKIYVLDENKIVVSETNLIVRENIEKIDFTYSLKNILKNW